MTDQEKYQQAVEAVDGILSHGVIILVVVGAGLLYGAGYFLQHLSNIPKQPATTFTMQPEAIIPSNPTPTTSGVLQAVEKPMPDVVTVYETKIITEIIPVKPFKNYAELETWLKAHVIGVLSRGDGSNPLAQDCDDYTELLINWAAKDGYQLMACPVKDGYVWTDYVYSKPGIHVGCWAWIGNDIYYIEPTENNKVTKLKTTRD